VTDFRARPASREQEIAELDRMIAFMEMLERIEWESKLPRRYRLIWRYLVSRHRLEMSRARYERTVTDGINTPAEARRKWRYDALRMTEEDFRRGEMLEDVRDYRYTCELPNLPLCCPHYVRRFEALPQKGPSQR
jgi:hypothetical protein